MFIRFDVIHKRDGRTDRQTDGQTLHDSKDRACIALRGKNLDFTVPFARGRHTVIVLCWLPFHSPGGATKLLLFRVLFNKSLLFKNVSTQSPTFVLGVPIVRQLLPTPKSVCYISNNTYSASFSRFCPIL